MTMPDARIGELHWAEVTGAPVGAPVELTAWHRPVWSIGIAGLLAASFVQDLVAILETGGDIEWAGRQGENIARGPGREVGHLVVDFEPLGTLDIVVGRRGRRAVAERIPGNAAGIKTRIGQGDAADDGAGGIVDRIQSRVPFVLVEIAGLGGAEFGIAVSEAGGPVPSPQRAIDAGPGDIGGVDGLGQFGSLVGLVAAAGEIGDALRHHGLGNSGWQKRVVLEDVEGIDLRAIRHRYIAVLGLGIDQRHIGRDVRRQVIIEARVTLVGHHRGGQRSSERNRALTAAVFRGCACGRAGIEGLNCATGAELEIVIAERHRLAGRVLGRCDEGAIGAVVNGEIGAQQIGIGGGARPDQTIAEGVGTVAVARHRTNTRHAWLLEMIVAGFKMASTV